MNIKRYVMFAAAALAAAVLAGCATTAPVKQELSIEMALRQAAEYFSASQYIKRGSTIAIIGISSPSPAMSDFMLDEATLRFVQERKLNVTNIESLKKIATEMNLRLSGELTENVIQKVGSMLGANVVIHGRLMRVSRNYNLVIQAFDTATAVVVDACKLDVAPNITTESLYASVGYAAAAQPITGQTVAGQPMAVAQPTSSQPSAPYSGPRYSGDLEAMLGMRTLVISGTAFLLGAQNFNLFNKNSVFSIGFFESLAGSLGDIIGVNLIVGPAVGLNIKDKVKLQLATGLSVGIDIYDRDYKNSYGSSGFGFASNTTIKFAPGKACSPFVSIQTDVKPSPYFPAANIAAGLSFNFKKA